MCLEKISLSSNQNESSNKALDVESITEQLQHVKLSDIALIKSRLNGLKKVKNDKKKQSILQSLALQVNASIESKKHKLQNRPKVSYPQALPVSQSVDRIKSAIEENQVVIIAGETGSGKTTQIPKICLELGRGIEGAIGHTQPRRIAARTVANRIAEELNTKLGSAVGYKVRFTDHTDQNSYIKLMTDGILLAEMQQDRLLRQYDTLIIDEAHERSLNIDFILGYVKEILPKRPDLKVIITSATIDPERFSKHFNNAPIIEVSGRTYPVEMRYRPLHDDEDNRDVVSGIIDAIDELTQEQMGDILVFLNGEREIRDTAQALEKENYRDTHILPLYSRLTVQEQNKIFQPHTGRNIVLATNVAETSLTVPGIKYVIDPGTARISRYSYRTKVQRLPIEAISQASANQRAGRCGRVSDGICIRLYSEEDFIARSEFTDPEILRTNLATVILQMLALGLGNIRDFPFVQPPDNRNINDGLRLLEELAAVKQSKDETQLTKVGRSLAKFPVDPRLAKMVLSSIELGCIEQVLIITAALSIQDPKERPHEKQQAADEKHSRFKDKTSDFISFVKLWRYIEEQQKALSGNQFRKLCQKEYLSYIRIREWQDIVSQLKYALKDMGVQVTSINEESESAFDIVHQALLSGLLSHIGQLDENREYKGARNSRFYIFPGSGVAKKSPKWIMATELVETSRLFGRTVAKIDVNWLESLAGHLVKKSYSEPHWEKKLGAVFGYEQISLYGLIIVGKRKINFNKIEPHTCREIFIREALVNGDANIQESFYKANKQLVAEIEGLEQKARRKEYLVDEDRLYEFFDEKLPESVLCQRSFLAWWKKEKQTKGKLLSYTKAFLLNESAEKLNQNEYPDVWQQGNLTLPLSYHFQPGDDDDGISLNIPVGILNQIENKGFDWLIPALRYDLIVALIKALPKTLRRNFVPAPNYADACMNAIEQSDLSMQEALAKQLLKMSGVRIPEEAWHGLVLPEHLKMNFKVIDEKGKLLKQSRDLDGLRESLQGKVKASIKKVAEKGIERTDITAWDFDSIPASYEKKVANMTIKAFPALTDKGNHVDIQLFEQEEIAGQAMLDGVSRLLLMNIPSPIKYLQEKLPNKAKLGLYFNPFGSINELLEDCILAACRHLVSEKGVARDESSFNALRDHVRAEIADLVLTTAIKVEQALSLAHDINKKLKGNVPLNVIQSHGDIKQQLGTLVYKGFVTTSGFNRLDNIIRYLKTIIRRLEKLPIDPNQDRLKMIEIQKVQDAYDQLLSKQRKGIPLPKEMAETRWMIEELKVSLYAQNLKTAYPISSKRILNHLKSLS